MLLLGGTGPAEVQPNRRPWIDWIHTASVQANIVRDFVKWDDEPHDLARVDESFARGLTAATSASGGPVYLCYDVDLQEDPSAAADGIAHFATPSPPAPSGDDVAGARAPAAAAATPGDPRRLRRRGALRRPLPWSSWPRRSAHRSSTPACGTRSRPAPARGRAPPPRDPRRGRRRRSHSTSEELGSHLGARLRDGSVTVLNVTLAHMKLRAWAHDYQPMVPSQRQITASADVAVAALVRALRAAPLPADETEQRRSAIAARTGQARAALARAGRQRQRRRRRPA